MYVIETMTPEGPHWYEGWNRKQKGEAVIQGFQWTPYFTDAFLFEHLEYAESELAKVTKDMPGAKIVPEEKALKHEGWELIDEYTYAIRAKYMKVGQRILISGYASGFKVIERGKDQFRLLAYAGYHIRIGVNSMKKVFVSLSPVQHERTNSNKTEHNDDRSENG